MNNNYYVHATDIVGYTFNTDIYCPDCIVGLVAAIPRLGVGVIHEHTTEGMLDAHAAALGVDRYDESSFDSSEFPKVIFASMVDSEGEWCGLCHEPLEG